MQKITKKPNFTTVVLAKGRHNMGQGRDRYED